MSTWNCNYNFGYLSNFLAKMPHGEDADTHANTLIGFEALHPPVRVSQLVSLPAYYLIHRQAETGVISAQWWFSMKALTFHDIKIHGALSSTSIQSVTLFSQFLGIINWSLGQKGSRTTPLSSFINPRPDGSWESSFSQRLRCSRICRITDASGIKLMIFISPPHFEDSIGSTSHIFLIHSRQVFDGIFLGSYSDKTISICKLRAKDSEKVHLEINRAECFIKSAKRLLRLMWYIQMKIAKEMLIKPKKMNSWSETFFPVVRSTYA